MLLKTEKVNDFIFLRAFISKEGKLQINRNVENSDDQYDMEKLFYNERNQSPSGVIPIVLFGVRDIYA